MTRRFESFTIAQSMEMKVVRTGEPGFSRPGVRWVAITFALALAHCAPGQGPETTYRIGGVVTGLVGAGLVLQNTGGELLSVSGSGPFAFPTMMASGTSYAITVASQPAGPPQTCSVANGSGTVISGDVIDVTVSCVADAHHVRGTVTGLTGAGLVLGDNQGDELRIATDGVFFFAAPIPNGGAYAVTVEAQPSDPWQTCTVVNGAGTVAGADIVDVAVTCTTNRYTIRGAVTGMEGTGLVIQDSGGELLSISGSGTFTLPTTMASGTSYAITVAAQPANPAQTCAVVNGSGTVTNGDVTDVTVSCVTNAYHIRGTVTGLAGTGLVVRDNGVEDLHLVADGIFSFATPVPSGGAYAVTVQAQPQSPWQTCTVANGAGTVTAADVADVAITCSTNTYRVRGTVSGLSGVGLVLRNGGESLAVGTSGAFSFATPVPSGGAYAVTVQAQPQSPWQTCTVANGAGAVAGVDVADVTVTCTTNRYAIRGAVTGMAGVGLVLQNTGGELLSIPGSGAFTFPTTMTSGASYAITVAAQPANPAQTCTVANGAGTVANADVTDVSVGCTTNEYSVGGIVRGLVGSGLVLRNNGANPLAIDSNGTFAFTVQSGASYAITVASQPSSPSQTCTVVNGTGTVTQGHVTNIEVTCGIGPAPMPLVSRGVPAFASSGTASAANDADYATEWTGTGPSWLAYDLASAGTLGNALVSWYNNETVGYDQTYATETTGLPGDYTVEVHGDTGSGTPPSSGWVPVVTVSGNQSNNHQHAVDLQGQRWIRFSGVPHPMNQESNISLNLDVFDARGGFTDSWIFVGDSNTAIYMTHEPREGLNFSERIQTSRPTHFPAYLNCGVPGARAIEDGLSLVQQVLSEYPQARYVAIALGGNDALSGLPTDDAFYNAYRDMVAAVVAAGRIPIVPRTVIWHGVPEVHTAIGGSSPYSLNNQLQRLLVDYSATIVPGPDLWTSFENDPRGVLGEPLDTLGNSLFEADLTHVTWIYGTASARSLWSDAMIGAVY